MKPKRKAPGTAPTVAEGKAKTTTSEASTYHSGPQDWFRWHGPCGHFAARRHYTLIFEGGGWFLVEWPARRAIWAGSTRPEAMRFALEVQGKSGVPIMAEGSL